MALSSRGTGLTTPATGICSTAALSVGRESCLIDQPERLLCSLGGGAATFELGRDLDKLSIKQTELDRNLAKGGLHLLETALQFVTPLLASPYTERARFGEERADDF